MTLPIQLWAVRKKRTMGKRIPRSFFKSIPMELQSKIFDRLSSKDQSSAMCVSQSWRERILYTTLPKVEPLQPLVSLLQTPFLDLNLQQLFDWCSRVIRVRDGLEYLMDTCNGLLMFCHKNGGALNLTHDIFHYYVINYFTKQCVAVLKPTAQTSSVYSFATLVYDPKESWFFKIMRFQGRRHVNVFSSESGVWTTLTLCLPEYITTSSMMQQHVYLNGSVYRLSRSGHLVRIRVDPQENVLEQAETIALTHDCLIDFCHWILSVKGGKIIFIISRGVNFCVYELVELVTRGVTSYSWCNIHRIEDARLWDLNTFGDLLAFHPHYDVAFFKRHKDLFYYFKIGNNNIIDLKPVPYSKILYDYLSYCDAPLLECFTSFICCLNKENSRVFQRIPIPP